ncbi:MAG: sulfite oxidase heme-binding subunit YedZ [Gammaproteobacteria bacterium]|jgi:sulfoxide reductase heme-binding subunit YedZ
MPEWTSAVSTEPRRARPGPSPALRALVFAACLLPLARLFLLGFNDSLGANPVEFVSRSTGTWTLVMLCLTLSVTPLRQLSGWNAVIRLRRMLGLFAFFYGCLHLMSYVWFDQWFDAIAILVDLLERPFIAAGFAAWLLMLPLALTSNAAMIRRLGRHWAELHRAVYAVAALGVLHFWWHKAGKNDLAEPMAYAAVVGLLLGWRLWRRLRGAQPGSRRSSA